MDKFSERRLVENELMFRAANRKVQQQVQKDRNRYEGTDKTKLRFYCECSNFHCRGRISLTINEYQAATTNNREFVILPGHENKSVEKIVRTEDDFMVVEKNMDPAKVMKQTQQPSV
jgi:hypothetical protein